MSRGTGGSRSKDLDAGCRQRCHRPEPPDRFARRNGSSKRGLEVTRPARRRTSWPLRVAAAMDENGHPQQSDHIPCRGEASLADRGVGGVALMAVPADVPRVRG